MAGKPSVLMSAGLLLFALLGCGGAPRGTIGAVLGQQNDGRVYVRDAPPGLGAANAGLRPGDEILFIDGVEARRMTSTDVHRALSGPLGAPVKLTVIRSGKVIRLTVTRTEPHAYEIRREAGPVAPPAATPRAKQ